MSTVVQGHIHQQSYSDDRDCMHGREHERNGGERDAEEGETEAHAGATGTSPAGDSLVGAGQIGGQWVPR